MVNTFDDKIKDLQLYNEQLEQQLLGCILIQNKVLRIIEIELTDEGFYFEINKQIYEVIKNLVQTGKQADEQTLYYSMFDFLDS